MTNGTSFEDAILLTSSFQSQVSQATPNIYFEINVIEGVTYTFTTLSDKDFVAYLYDSGRKELAWNDDGGLNRNPRIDFTATYTGKMYTMIKGWRASEVGSFEAVFSEKEVIAGDSFETAINIGIGEGQTVTLYPDLYNTYFVMNTVIGGDYHIESKGDYDLMISVYNSEFDRITSDDDSGEGYNFLVDFIAETSITYFTLRTYDSLNVPTDMTIDIIDNGFSDIEEVTIQPSTLYLKKGETYKLIAIVMPLEALDKSVRWASSDDSGLSVDNDGVVTAHEYGTYWIEATSIVGRKVGYSEVAVVPFAGEGTANKPYLIYNAEELTNVSLDLSGYYRQMNDIDLGEQKNWTPIGYDLNYRYFNGVYDGNNFKISNLTIDDRGNPSLALFGYCLDATLKNIRIENFNIRGLRHNACLASVFNRGKMINCHASGKVVAYNGTGKLDGLVGNSSACLVAIAFATTIEYCSASGTVEGWMNISGLISAASDTLISKCYSSVDVFSHAFDVGGIVAYSDTNIHIKDCYNTGNLTGEYAVGGILARGDEGVIIENCYNLGNMTAQRSTGGIAHSLPAFSDAETPVFKNSFYLGEYFYTEGDGRYAGGGFTDIVLPIFQELDIINCYSVDDFQVIPPVEVFTITATGRITRTQAQQRSTYERLGWDFDTVWTIDENNGYPTLLPYVPTLSTSEGYSRAVLLSNLVFKRMREPRG